MTPEQRLDRLERIAKLFVAAGIRARRDMRRWDEKIGMLVDAQIQNEARTAENSKQIKVLIALQKRNDLRFAKSDERFAKLEKQTDQTLKVVTELVKERRRNGKS